MAGQPLIQHVEDRAEPRAPVYHRTKATLADRRAVPIIVVNLSPHGMMARTDADIAAGEWLTVKLPVVGLVSAAVRWSLGGRIGCQFDRPIGPGEYGEVLAIAAA